MTLELELQVLFDVGLWYSKREQDTDLNYTAKSKKVKTSFLVSIVHDKVRDCYRNKINKNTPHQLQILVTQKRTDREALVRRRDNTYFRLLEHVPAWGGETHQKWEKEKHNKSLNAPRGKNKQVS